MNQSMPSIRKRSPRFPSHSLSDAMNYAEKLYKGVHRSSVDSDTAVRVMGFSGKSGASASALGSVRQFGLIEGFSENTRISDLALTIFEPASNEEYSRALRQAAFEPKVFSDISERFGGKIPIVDEPIRAYLVRDLNFSSKGAKSCIDSLRLTLQFISEFENDSENDSVESDQEEIEASEGINGAPPTSPTLEEVKTPPSTHAEHARFPLSKDCYAELTLYGVASEKAWENLRKQVDYLIETMTGD